MDTRGLKVLVTGGGSGIGLALARRLAGTNRVVIGGRDLGKLEAAVERTPSLQAKRLDVTDEGQARKALEEVVTDLGGLNLLVNGAGTISAYRFNDDDGAEQANRDIQVNFLGTLRMTRLALPYLRLEEQAAVVFFSSVVAIAPAPGYAVYSATKAAVHSMARSLRRELAGSIRLVDVLPTWVDTAPARAISMPKLEPEVVAGAIIRGLERDRQEVLVGRAGTVALVERFSPWLADALVARATK
jgi:uncharacterized oxidoreductase